MLVQICYFATLVLTALLMGTSFAHALEMPQKLSVDGQTWLTFQHTLYPYFAYIGGPLELGRSSSQDFCRISCARTARVFSRARRGGLSGDCILCRVARLYQSGQCSDREMDRGFDTGGLGALAQSMGIFAPRALRAAFDRLRRAGHGAAAAQRMNYRPAKQERKSTMRENILSRQLPNRLTRHLPNRWNRSLTRIGANKIAVGSLAMGSQALGALAVGACAIGALVIGRLVLKRLLVGTAGARSIEVDSLDVKHLRVGELEIDGKRVTPETGETPA